MFSQVLRYIRIHYRISIRRSLQALVRRHSSALMGERFTSSFAANARYLQRRRGRDAPRNRAVVGDYAT
jgi:hypothetical protein